ncbi:MAG: caspase family protein, partial [Bacteroidota bacterium]
MPISRNIELEFRKSHAFVIGIDEYPNLKANLETPAKDAREVAKRLKVLQGFDHVLLMNNVGLEQLRELLAWLKDPQRPKKLSIENQVFQTADGEEYESRISWLSTEKGEQEGEKKSKRDLRLTFEGETTRLYEWREMELDIQKEKEKKLDEEQLEEQNVEITKGDSLVFYYAGHGYPGEVKAGPSGFLAPTDAVNKRTNNQSLLPMEEVYEALSETGCKHTLLILDCCFAGKFRFTTLGRGDSLPFLAPLHERRYKRYKYSKAWQVLASAGPNQEANDSAEWAEIRNNSPFAETFIEALEGKADTAISTNRGKNPGDGIITATELFLYVWERVESITQGVKPQHPSLFPMQQHEEGEFIFINPKIKKDRLEFGADPDKNPYKGLKSYEEEDANRFFGREGAIKKAIEMLDKEGLLFVSGASGAGKSSLVKAGIFPNYPETKKVVIRPVDLLGEEHEAEQKFQNQLTLLQREEKGSIILFIDQYEERFGHGEEELIGKRIEELFH